MKYLKNLFFNNLDDARGDVRNNAKRVYTGYLTNKYGSGHRKLRVQLALGYITIVCGPKNMSLEKYILISQKNNHHGCSYESLYRVD